MNIAITSRATSSVSTKQLDHLTNRLNALVSVIENPFGMVIYDYSQAANRLVKIIDIHPFTDGRFSADLDRVFPSLAARANRMIVESRGRRSTGIMPLDLKDGSSLLIVASAMELTIIGFKSKLGAEYNHQIIRSVLETFAEIRENTPAWQPAKIANFHPVDQIALGALA